jgi:hypothetical protein
VSGRGDISCFALVDSNSHQNRKARLKADTLESIDFSKVIYVCCKIALDRAGHRSCKDPTRILEVPSSNLMSLVFNWSLSC